MRFLRSTASCFRYQSCQLHLRVIVLSNRDIGGKCGNSGGRAGAACGAYAIAAAASRDCSCELVGGHGGGNGDGGDAGDAAHSGRSSDDVEINDGIGCGGSGDTGACQ